MSENSNSTPPSATESVSRKRPVAVLGLGPMGMALTGALRRADIEVLAWNRSEAALRQVAELGSIPFDNPSAAVTGVELILVCVRDHHAAREVIGALDPVALGGATVVNLSSSTPQQARQSARWATDRGLSYLSGAIMVPTPMIGSEQALILYSGAAQPFARHESVLRVLAGDAQYLGTDDGLAALFDVGMLEMFFAGLTAFLHAAAMTTAAGVSAVDFLPFAKRIVDVLHFSLDGVAAAVDAGSYPGDEDRLSMELAAMEHIVAAGEEAHLDNRLSRYLRDLALEAIAAGGGEDSWARTIEILRAGAHQGDGR